MDYRQDSRTILSLDAGGTNFDFFAVRAGEIIAEKVRLPADAGSLEKILKNIIGGFEEVKKQIKEDAVAISFCFPGPADYEKGIIGDLENLPLFRGGVALKAMLEDHFGIPVYINNDGDLFTYGEAMAGLLADLNTSLSRAGNPRQYENLLGVTFGTGFGGGIVRRGALYRGDNSAAAEINRMRNKLYPQTSAEDSVTIRAIKRVYSREAGISLSNSPEPADIYRIGSGELEGDQQAARRAFLELAEVAGSSIADAVTLTDSIVVIGGGLSGAWPLFLQALVDEMNSSFTELGGDTLPRMEVTAYNLEEEKDLKAFIADTSEEISIPFSGKTLPYDPVKKIGVGISRLGTSKAVAVGAYAYALNELSSV